ncbi:hypothetical protein E1K50_19830 [Salmonella enterica subsp. enterica serovar Java]|nr:hypothetical protein [Salmonella enterica]EBZ0864365.1 hypothetical protein [Salmonella enterica subsp. enterica serovar Ajiobo]ECB7872101.1 hypothetical protein [Salmonella enterica subsp. enterica serovar Agona]ECG1227873.1 hypothetical protein [Salmonella enterica subsp. enterica serovar Paratyphi B]ECG5501301.1 hypothetical protein [Salmonella enterica subsp. enterica serovar Java]ECQ9037736.1 hypothetical protein [Salmonella enterica subsp. enterica]EDN3718891.1 hypothetical protein [
MLCFLLFIDVQISPSVCIPQTAIIVFMLAHTTVDFIPAFVYLMRHTIHQQPYTPLFFLP